MKLKKNENDCQDENGLTSIHTAVEDYQRNLKRAQKKMREIEELEDKMKNGYVDLQANQIEKLGMKSKLKEEISQLRSLLKGIGNLNDNNTGYEQNKKKK
ncbi:MAG: hypothetical protein EZS28_017145 [Streblomastix strix]|uniref:Uncharacterized protein n=1 Tax=Streblomastix strix TaxID=222440 RepID=A0A5J4VYK2_9EUKA|nr:MAG: hypothetical protein EZS28_017145 [Streblomastix strix]